MFRSLPVVLALLIAAAAPARAQQSLKLEFSSGQVTLHAQNAPVRAILAEWARLGGATIVNGDRVAGPPLTLELTNVPEREALDVILRSVAGYMLAPRPAGSAGASTFDRIMILPTSTAPRPVTPAPQALGAPRPVLPRPQVLRQPEETSADDAPDDSARDDADAPIAQPRPANRVVAPARPGQPPQPLVPEPEIVSADDQQESEPSPQEGVAPTPANPFGLPFGSSARPGIVTPVPQPQQTTRPQQ